MARRTVAEAVKLHICLICGKPAKVPKVPPDQTAVPYCDKCTEAYTRQWMRLSRRNDD